MNDSELILLREEIRRLRRGHRVHRYFLALSLAGILCLVAIGIGNPARVSAQSTNDKDGILHIRGLVVEDADGHERLRLGAPLPDPLIHGVRRKRAGAVSGLLITDPDGNERGGYVTSDKAGEAFLTLDSEDDQQVMLLTNPKGGANFYLRDKANMAQITVFAGEVYGTSQLPDGPKLTLTKARQTLATLPENPK
jgi:hypothetical protein